MKELITGAEFERSARLRMRLVRRHQTAPHHAQRDRHRAPLPHEVSVSRFYRCPTLPLGDGQRLRPISENLCYFAGAERVCTFNSSLIPPSDAITPAAS